MDNVFEFCPEIIVLWEYRQIKLSYNLPSRNNTFRNNCCFLGKRKSARPRARSLCAVIDRRHPDTTPGGGYYFSAISETAAPRRTKLDETSNNRRDPRACLRGSFSVRHSSAVINSGILIESADTSRTIAVRDLPEITYVLYAI